MTPAQFGARTVTFLFTDIERSTRNWERDEREMLVALERHDRLIQESVAAHGGAVFKHTGDGVAAAFRSSTAAVAAAVDVQRRMKDEALRVRIGVHTGEAYQRSDDYFGPAVNRAARLADAAHGGQVLVSAATAALVRGRLDADMALVPLGLHVLRDLGPEDVCQVTAPGMDECPSALRARRAEVQAKARRRPPLIGRDRDLGVATGMLAPGRVVTLTGIGGCGKTRLALAVAARVGDDYPGGTYIVELAATTDPALVGSTFAAALGLQLGARLGGIRPEPIAEAVEFLAGQTALVVLDNCEHLLDATAELVETLLERCPSIALLATSREALGVEGELPWRVPSLALPGHEGDPATSASVELFVERACAADPTFRLTDKNTAAVAEICRRLDGIPLAIELAAAQIAYMTPDQIAARLGDRFRLLTGGRRKTQRQQTLHATLDWSHGLLDDAERAALRRLAVFSAPFELEAAEAVCGDELERPAAAVLGALVAKSLVVVESDDVGARYRLLETVRLYAEEKLDLAGESETYRNRHLAWYADQVSRVPYDRGFVGFTTAIRLDRSLGNLRTALDWAAESQSLSVVAEMAPRMTSLWWMAGISPDEGRRWFELALSAKDRLSARAASACETGLGFMATMDGDIVGAGDLWAAAVETEATGEPALIARLMACLVQLLTNPASVESELLGIEREARASRSSIVVTGASGYLGLVHLNAGRLEDARRLFEASIARADPEEATFFDISAAFGLAVTLHLLGDHDGCVEVAKMLDGLPASDHDLGNAFEVTRDTTTGWTAHNFAGALARLARGFAATGRRRAEEARREAGEVVALARRRRLALVERDVALVLAAAALADESPHRAAVLLAAARGQGPFAMFRTPPSYALYHHYRARVRQQLRAEEVSEARQRGADASLEALIAAELTPPPSRAGVEPPQR